MTDLSIPASTPAEELIHDMRNCLFAIQSVARALPMIRNDDKQFKMAHEALSQQADALKKLLAQAEPLIKRT